MAGDIEVEGLGRTFRVPVREAGLRAAARALVRREHELVTAVADLSLLIEPGEVVGFLGPNGAGKTTSLKMLAGLLHPTSGTARVLGRTPWLRERAHLGRITLVMGNRNQLQWDLPVVDSFEMNRAIFAIPRADFTRSRDELVELLEIGDLITKPVRNLSLGERMKAEIAGALLHRPQVLFLDEPTIGLDVTMQKRIRRFLADYNRRHGATIMLTSHYMADVQALCRRVVVIHHGRKRFDGPLAELAETFSSHRTLRLTVPEAGFDPSRYGEVVESAADGRIAIRVPRGEVSAVAARMLAEQAVADLTVEDVPIDDVIEGVYAEEAEGAGAEGATG